LIGVNGTSLLAISTPDDQYNYYSKLLELKDPDNDGQLMFNVIKIGLNCENCTKLNKTCPHMQKKLPEWKSGARMRKVEVIMASQPEALLRESRGVVADVDKPMYEKADIDAFSTRELFQIDPTKHGALSIHIGIDPSGGGSMSDFAIATMTKFQTSEIVSNKYIYILFI
jgi:hypothetical protein